MPLEFRTLMFGILTLMVIFLIIADIAEVEEELALMFRPVKSTAFIRGTRDNTCGASDEGGKFHRQNVKPKAKISMKLLVSTKHGKPLGFDEAELVEKGKTAIKVDPTPSVSQGKDISQPLQPSLSNTTPTNWTFNKTLSNLIRKNILRFLDPERDISILKGTLKPGDIIHYVFDRQSTTNISENLYRLLPTASPMKNQHHRRCAIVGNSGILLNSKCNLAPVEEFSGDVGWRTNLVTMNPSVVQRAFQDLASEEWRERFVQRLRSLRGSVLWIPAFMAKGGEERVEWAIRLILLHTVDVHTAFPSLRLLHAVRGYWLTNNVQIKRPTTGLLMYTMATRFCEEIHLYGFWPFPLDPHGKPVKYHYYDTLTYEYTSQSSPHTMPLEFRTLSTLHRQGALQLHTGACDAEKSPQKEQQQK